MNPNLMLRNPTFCHGGRLRITHVKNPFQYKTVRRFLQVNSLAYFYDSSQ